MVIMKIECSNFAYQKLRSIGIEDRTKESKEDLTQIFLFKTIWQGMSNHILENVKKAKLSGDILNEEQQDILSLEAELEEDSFVFQIEPYVVKHPYLVARLVLGDDLDKFSQFSFSSKKDLADAVNAYCIGEKKSINKDKESYVWRQGDYKNNVSLMDHGDMLVSQTNVSGMNDSGVLIDPPRFGFGLEQDWSPFLYSVLKYARALGKQDSPEIINWKELVKELRWSNPWGNSYSEDFTRNESHLSNLSDTDLFGFGKNNLRLWVNNHVLPYFIDGNLDFLRKDVAGDLEVCLYTKPEKFTRVAHFVPEDIPHLLKANYQLYARNVGDLAKIMYFFNKDKQ